jgi:hypothetical protein
MQNVFRDPKNSIRIPFVYRGQATSIILKLRKKIWHLKDGIQFIMKLINYLYILWFILNNKMT